jgi:hypothetical protein
MAKLPTCTCTPVRGIHAIFCPAKNNQEERRSEYKNKAQNTVFYIPATAQGQKLLTELRAHLNREWWTLRTKNRGTNYSRYGTCLAENRTHFAVYLDKISTPEQSAARAEEWRQQWEDKKDASFHRTYCAARLCDAVSSAHAQAKNEIDNAADIARRELFSASLFNLLRQWWQFRKANRA